MTCQYFIEHCQRRTLDGGSIFRILAPCNDAQEPSPHIQVVQLGTRLGLHQPREHIVHESTALSGLHHERWSVSAARFAPGEVYGSFFVCMRDEPELDFGGARQRDGLGYAAFGHVERGHETLLKLYASAQDQPELDRPIRVDCVRVIDLNATPDEQATDE